MLILDPLQAQREFCFSGQVNASSPLPSILVSTYRPPQTSTLRFSRIWLLQTVHKGDHRRARADF